MIFGRIEVAEGYAIQFSRPGSPRVYSPSSFFYHESLACFPSPFFRRPHLLPSRPARDTYPLLHLRLRKIPIMPAERTRGSRRTESDGEIRLEKHQQRSISSFRERFTGQRLVWTMPVEPMDASGVSFTTTITPTTFNDGPPPLVDAPPTEVILFPPTEEGSPASRRPAHSKKKPENHIPRPPNAFILFRSSFIKSQHVSTEVETNHSTLSKIIGLTWQNLPEQERQVWHAKAKAALEEHKRKFPQYAFRPTQSKKGGTAEKRRVREVEPKDMKRCAKIAELLATGMKGQELESAMAEFDKHHVPEVVTRFEAPITARTYRRSSSAPIPDTENTKSQQSFFTTVTSIKNGRASSTRPTRYPTPEVNQAASLDLQSLKQEPSFVSPPYPQSRHFSADRYF